MLDIKFIRENKDLVAAGAQKKHIDFDIKKLLAFQTKSLLRQIPQSAKR
mgnify:CR=1 FL=1